MYKPNQKAVIIGADKQLKDEQVLTQKKPNYREIKDRYSTIREDSRKTALGAVPQVIQNRRGTAILKGNISLDGFTPSCKKKLRKWENCDSRRVAWDWEEVQKKYKTHPKRFELSIWHREFTLCGVSIGRPTWTGGKLRLDYLEAAPLESPLDGLITDITIAAGVVYARAIGAIQLRIMNPVNEDVRNLYLSKPGFSYDKLGNFCYRDLL